MFDDFVNCQVCEYNPTGDKCELFGRVIGMHGCSSGVERKPRNHFEEVKAMSMEEMALFFQDIEVLAADDSLGREKWLEWLKEEVKE